jgi:hypothetical protein
MCTPDLNFCTQNLKHHIVVFISDKFVFTVVSSEPKSMHSLARPTSQITSTNNPPISQSIAFDSSALNLFNHPFHFGCCPN